MSSSSAGALSLADRRRAEIEAKRAKLAALKKSREERTRNLSRSDRMSSVFTPSPSCLQRAMAFAVADCGPAATAAANDTG